MADTTEAQQQPLATPSGPELAVFDFDGTLLKGDTLLVLHNLQHNPAARLLALVRLIPAALAWKTGARGTAWFKERTLRRLLSSQGEPLPATLLTQQLPARLLADLNPAALIRLEQHRGMGHRLIIVSASPRQLLQPVADRLGCELLATETTDLTLHGPEAPLRLVSANCKGAEKVRRLEAALGQPLHSVAMHAYGDSRGDRELLQAARYPHWRSFSAQPVPYPVKTSGPPLVRLLALALLGVLGWGLLQLPAAHQQDLLTAMAHLPAWLPALYATLAASFLLRYFRWRLLLGALGIGRWGLADAIGWFRGFALTATPA